MKMNNVVRAVYAGVFAATTLVVAACQKVVEDAHLPVERSGFVQDRDRYVEGHWAGGSLESTA